MLWMNVETRPDRFVLRFTDANCMDEAPQPEVVATFSAHCERATLEGRTVLVDLQKVRSMSSVMAGRLVLLKKISKQNGVDVRLINLSDQLLAVMRLTRLDRLFQFGER